MMTNHPKVTDVVAEIFQDHPELRERYHTNAQFYNELNQFLGAVEYAADALLETKSTAIEGIIEILVRGFFDGRVTKQS